MFKNSGNKTSRSPLQIELIVLETGLAKVLAPAFPHNLYFYKK